MAINTPTTNSERHKPSLPLNSAAAIANIMAALFLSSYAHAEDWRITPTLDVRQTYTDNVRLAPSGSARSDFITDIAPGISVSRDGPRLKVATTYALHYVTYARDSEGSRIDHQLNALANAELIDKLFFIDGAAAINQHNISALGPQPTDNTNVTGNRATVRSYNISPYLLHSFGSTASSELRYRHSSTSANTGGLSDSRTDAMLFRLDSGPAFKTLGWGLQHSDQKTKYDDPQVPTQTVDSTTTSGRLRYMISPQLHLIGTLGYDKYNYASVAEPPKGRFYTGGFSWTPTQRTSISASAGERFWGRTYSLDTSVRSRTTLWHVAYNEDITTTQSQFSLMATESTSNFLNQLFAGTISDPVARQQVVDRFIASTGLPPSLSRSVNYFTNQFFLQKSLRASVAVTGAKNTVVVTLFDVDRQAQTALVVNDPLFGAGNRALDGSTRQAGVNATWNWRVAPRTSATFSTGYARTKHIATDETQKTKTIRAALARQLMPNLNGVVEVRRQDQDSNVARRDYVENAITVSLSMRF